MRYLFLTPWRFERNAPSGILFASYLERISKQVSCEHQHPKSSPNNADDARDFLVKELEKNRTNSSVVVCLDENGKLLKSREFADLLSSFEGQGVKQIVFCIGGAYGLPAEAARATENIRLVSLSPMTFPHEMAAAMLAEQVYRARTILGGHPYHHGESSHLFKTLR
jgi:23S rRNA (pseudouridine1915-N3)-methyltransferase